MSIYLSFHFNLSFFSLQSIFLFVSIYLSFRFNLSLFTLQFFPLWSVLFSLRTYITQSVSSLSLAPIHVNVYPSLCRSVFSLLFSFSVKHFYAVQVNNNNYLSLSVSFFVVFSFHLTLFESISPILLMPSICISTNLCLTLWFYLSFYITYTKQFYIRTCLSVFLPIFNSSSIFVFSFSVSHSHFRSHQV